MSELAIRGVSKRFGAFQALDDVTLAIPEGSLMCLLGPSGCGKTTLLRIVAGLETADAGSVSFMGEDMSGLAPHLREIGMVFQSHALFPHLSAGENIAYGLRIAGVAEEERRRRVEELLELVRLPGIGGKPVAQLSGGQRQRVSVARALARRPRIFLLDEPTSALDANLREAMQIELRRLQQELGITTIVVTHDQGEAMTLADLIVVMNEGRIEQIGKPLEIYERPCTAFVADFIGATNLLAGIWEDGGTRLGDGLAPVTAKDAPDGLGNGDPVRLSVRPEKIALAERGEGGDGPNRLDGTVSFVRNTGQIVEVFVDCGGVQIVHAYTPADTAAATRWSVGQQVSVRLPPEYCLLYGP